MATLDIGPRNYFKLHTDGSITAEQGQAEGEGAIGVVLRDPNGFVVHQISTRIGWVKDHHVAEYGPSSPGCGWPAAGSFATRPERCWTSSASISSAGSLGSGTRRPTSWRGERSAADTGVGPSC